MATCITHRTDVSHPVAGPRTRLRVGAVLPASDYNHLLEHLERCERDRGPSWTLLAYVLHDKIVNTEPCGGLETQDIVFGGSRVAYTVGGCRSLGPAGATGTTRNPAVGHHPRGVIAGGHPHRDADRQRAPLLCEDGTVTPLVVVDALPPI